MAPNKSETSGSISEGLIKKTPETSVENRGESKKKVEKVDGSKLTEVGKDFKGIISDIRKHFGEIPARVMMILLCTALLGAGLEVRGFTDLDEGSKVTDFDPKGNKKGFDSGKQEGEAERQEFLRKIEEIFSGHTEVVRSYAEHYQSGETNADRQNEALRLSIEQRLQTYADHLNDFLARNPNIKVVPGEPMFNGGLVVLSAFTDLGGGTRENQGLSDNLSHEATTDLDKPDFHSSLNNVPGFESVPFTVVDGGGRGEHCVVDGKNLTSQEAETELAKELKKVGLELGAFGGMQSFIDIGNGLNRGGITDNQKNYWHEHSDIAQQLFDKYFANQRTIVADLVIETNANAFQYKGSKTSTNDKTPKQGERGHMDLEALVSTTQDKHYVKQTSTDREFFDNKTKGYKNIPGKIWRGGAQGRGDVGRTYQPSSVGGGKGK